MEDVRLEIDLSKPGNGMAADYRSSKKNRGGHVVVAASGLPFHGS
jgi:hypothetical protein